MFQLRLRVLVDAINSLYWNNLNNDCIGLSFIRHWQLTEVDRKKKWELWPPSPRPKCPVADMKIAVRWKWLAVKLHVPVCVCVWVCASGITEIAFEQTQSGPNASTRHTLERMFA